MPDRRTLVTPSSSRRLLLNVFLLATLFSGACGYSAKLISRATSPDSKVVAESYFIQSLPLDADVDEVYLSKNDQKRANRILLAQNPQQITLRWKSNRTLVIEYDAEVVAFKNFWRYKSDNGKLHQVEIQLIQKGKRVW